MLAALVQIGTRVLILKLRFKRHLIPIHSIRFRTKQGANLRFVHCPVLGCQFPFTFKTRKGRVLKSALDNSKIDSASSGFIRFKRLGFVRF